MIDVASQPLRKKVVLITGATHPTGDRLAETFAEAGATLALCVDQAADLESARRRFENNGDRHFALLCDLRQEEEVVRTVHRVVQRLGRIDVVVNTATEPGPRLPLVDYPSDTWRDVIEANLTGAYLICREVLPWMTRQGSGSIINVTNSLASTARPQWGAYLVCTHGIEGLTQLLAAELDGTGVRANTVDVGSPHALSRGSEQACSRAMQAFLWLAHETSAATNGQRIRAADFA